MPGPAHSELQAVAPAGTVADRSRLRPGVVRYSAAELLIAQVLLLVISPFVLQARNGQFFEVVLMTVVLSSALLAVGGRRRTLAIGILLATLAIGGQWAHHFWARLVPLPAVAVPILLFVLFVVVELLRFVLRAPRVNSEVLCAGISAYLMLAILWRVLYGVVAEVVPNSFAFAGGPASGQTLSGFAALYFSLVTLSTVGYGDIVPVSDVARMLAATEALTGLFYVTVLIARLVALYSSQDSSDRAEDRGPGRSIP